MGTSTSVYNDTTPTARGLTGATLRYYAGETPRTEAGKVAMTTISNATNGYIPDSNKTGVFTAQQNGNRPQ